MVSLVSLGAFPIHLLFLLMDVFWPVPTPCEGTYLWVVFHMSLLIFAFSILPLPGSVTSSTIIIWDIQAGVIISSIPPQKFSEMVFTGNQRAITLFMHETFCTYDGLTGTQLCDGRLASSPQRELGAHWTHGESLQFATISDAAEKLMISVCELQPTSSPPLLMVTSFPMPFHIGAVYFSPITLHVSFVGRKEIVILNAQDSKILLQAKVLQEHSSSPCFSPNGHFFACCTQEQEITIWKNMSTGYMTWSTLRPRLPFRRFSFSPSGNSILSWGPQGTQLLDYTHPSSPPPVRIGSNHNNQRHLVRYSKDRTHIITARKGHSVITILDTLSGTLQQSINTNIEIWDLQIVDNTIHITDIHKLFSWHLEVCGMAQSAHDTNRVTVDLAIHVRQGSVEHIVISHDCSQIAFVVWDTVFLYDVKAQKFFDKFRLGQVTDILFSPDGCYLYVITTNNSGLRTQPFDFHFVKLEIGEDQCFVKGARWFVEASWSGDEILQSPHGYGTRSGSEWVEDFRGNKVLWLPPSWGVGFGLAARWDDNFLALVHGSNPMPIIIEFPSSSHQPHSMDM